MEGNFPLPFAIFHGFVADSLQLEVPLSDCGGGRRVVHVRTGVLEVGVGHVRASVPASGVGHVRAGRPTAECQVGAGPGICAT